MPVSGLEIRAAVVVGLWFLSRLAAALLDCREYRHAVHERDGVES